MNMHNCVFILCESDVHSTRHSTKSTVCEKYSMFLWLVFIESRSSIGLSAGTLYSLFIMSSYVPHSLSPKKSMDSVFSVDKSVRILFASFCEQVSVSALLLVISLLSSMLLVYNFLLSCLIEFLQEAKQSIIPKDTTSAFLNLI